VGTAEVNGVANELLVTESLEGTYRKYSLTKPKAIDIHPAPVLDTEQRYWVERSLKMARASAEWLTTLRLWKRLGNHHMALV